MRNSLLMSALAFALGLGVVAALPAPAPAAPEAASVAKLIEQLGSGDFEERDQASKALDAIGAPALDALRKAAEGHEDAEVRMRSGSLVKVIELRTVSASVLAPRKVHLVYKNTPLPEAVADFSKKTGYPIALNDPENKLQERKITLDTGDVPFWEAFDQFCAKAGLVEANVNEIAPIRRLPIRRGPVIQPLPPQQEQQAQPALKKQIEAQPAKPVEKEEAQPAQKEQVKQALKAEVQVQIQVQVQPGQPAVIQAQPAILVQPIGPGAGIGLPAGPGQIVLTDGTPKALPTDASGPVRVRALAENQVFGGAQPNEYLIPLQVTAEPRLRLQNVLSVTINRAIDDQDQALMQTTAEANPNAFQPPNGPAFRPGRVGIVRPPVVMDMQHQYVPVRLKQGTKASKSLKELSGVLSAQVLTEPKAVISADDILKAAGKTFKGEDGYIKVLEVSKDANDQITIRYEMQQPKDLIPANFNPYGDAAPVPLPPQKVLPGAQRGALQLQQAQQVQVQIAQPVQGGIAIAPQPDIAVSPLGVGNGISLLDEKGNPLPMAGVRASAARADGKGGVVVDQTVVFQTKGMGVPSKLVLAGSRSATVSVPFTLKNVPLN